MAKNLQVRLMVWVSVPNGAPYQAELYSADHITRRAYVLPDGDQCTHSIGYNDIASVALYEGNQVLQAFGRPPFAANAPAPAWVQYAEVMA